MDTQKDTTEQKPLWKGIALMVLAWTLFAFMSAFAKFSYRYTTPTVTFFFQNFGAFLTLLPFFYKEGPAFFKSPKRTLIVLRGVLGGFSFFLLFSSLMKIPLTDATLLNNTSPLFVPFLAAIFLQIPLRLSICLSAFVGFVGVIFILKPTGDIFQIDALPALISGILSSFILILMRKIADAGPKQILFAYLLITSATSATFAIPLISCLPLIAFAPLICVGILFGCGQYLFTRSFRYAEPTTLAPFTYTFVAVSSLLDWLLWNHAPTITSAIGIFLVFLGGVLTIQFSRRPTLVLNTEKQDSAI